MIYLNIYLLIPLIEVIFGITLLIVLTISGRQHVARRPFILFLFFMTLWGCLIFMMRASDDMASALLWEKFVFLAILGASLFFYHFTVAFTGTRPNKYFIYSLYTAFLAVMALIPTGLVVSGMRMMWYGKAPELGALFPLYAICAFVPIVMSAVILVRYYRQTRVIDNRVRAQYIIAGITAMLIGVTADYLPVLGIGLYPMGIIGNILFCLIATIAMLRHNLLDMKAVLRKGTTFSLTTAIIFGIFGSLLYLISYLFRDFLSPATTIITVVIVFIAASLFRTVLSRLQHTVDRWFFRETYHHIQTLKKFTQDTRGDLDLVQLSSSLVETVAKGMQSRGVYLLLPSPPSGTYMTYTYSGNKNLKRIYFTAGSPLVAAMNQRDGIIEYNDLDVLPSLIGLPSCDRETLGDNNIELMVPLRNNSHLAGMLLLSGKTSHEPYSFEERQLLQAISTDVAVNINNATHFDSMKRKHNELQKAMNGVIHAISQVVGSKDPYTASHQRRVAELARAIATELGLSEWQITGVYVAGLLHDVGKMAVPSEILCKSGKITSSEFNVIKDHCRVGYGILQKIEFPWPVTTAVLQHHERLDGSGYPGGLSGSAILLEARILGVADVVEAMSSHRPYRPALGMDSALKEIKRGSGSLYDPDIVTACLNVLKKDDLEFDRIMAVAETSQEYALEMVN